jgi:threonine/homoserine/homoserine lactone efflux protein
MIRAAADLHFSLESTGADAAAWWKLFVWGAAVSAVNPYFIGWWATIGAGQLSHIAPTSFTEYAAFFVGHEASDAIWYGFVALAIVTGRAWLTDGIYRGMIYTFGGLIGLLGLWFVIGGVRIVFRNRLPSVGGSK